MNPSGLLILRVEESFSAIKLSVGKVSQGESINGWEVNSVRYFGDELKCGVIEFGGGDGNAFQRGVTYTAEDGAQFEVLAGFGIPIKRHIAVYMSLIRGLVTTK